MKVYLCWTAIGASAKEIVNEDLIEASKNGDLIAIEEILRMRPSSLNRQNSKGETPLHWAAMNGRYPAVDAFLKCGANVSIRDYALSSTPLHWAVWGGCARIIGILLKYGAPIDSVDAYGYTPLILCAHLANVYSSIILTSNNANLDIRDFAGKTAISWAVSSNSVEIVRELIRSGANVALQDNSGKSPLYYAVLFSCNPEIVVSLIMAGANSRDMDSAKQLVLPRKKTSTRRIREYKSHLKVAGISRSKKKRIGVRTLYVVYMAAVFACIYFPLAYLELPYGVSCSVFLSLVVAQSILLLPKTSMGRSDDIAPCLVIFTMLLTASSIIIIAVDTCCQYPLSFYILGALVAVVMASYVATCTVEPGILPKVPPNSRRRIVNVLNDEGLVGNKSFCYTCYIKRPERSRHCNKCDVCIQKFDHHCVWVCGCIGKKNYKLFIVLITSMMAGIIFYIIAAVRYIVDEYDKSVNIPNGTALQYLGGAGSLYIVLTLIVAGVHALWLPMLVLLHIYFAAIGKTSAEYIVGRAHRHHHRKDG